MNLWQVTRQAVYLLDARTWTGSSNAVFGSGCVVASSMIPEEAKRTLRVPMALVYPVDGAADPSYTEQPGLIQSALNVTIVVAVPGDAVGEKAMIGGNVVDRTKSEGRGILEVSEEVESALGSLQTDNGLVIALHSATSRAPVYAPDIGYVAFRDLTFRVWCTSTRYYHPASYLTATGGSGQVSLAWGIPPDRYDRYRMVLRRNSGATIPTSITDGTGVTLASNLATSVTDSGLSAGTYSYALFATYDETNGRPDGTPASDARVSSSVTRQSVSVS